MSNKYDTYICDNVEDLTEVIVKNVPLPWAGKRTCDLLFEVSARALRKERKKKKTSNEEKRGKIRRIQTMAGFFLANQISAYFPVWSRCKPNSCDPALPLTACAS